MKFIRAYQMSLIHSYQSLGNANSSPETFMSNHAVRYHMSQQTTSDVSLGTAVYNEALAEDSETAASLSELRDRAVQHAERVVSRWTLIIERSLGSSDKIVLYINPNITKYKSRFDGNA